MNALYRDLLGPKERLVSLVLMAKMVPGDPLEEMDRKDPRVLLDKGGRGDAKVHLVMWE